MINRINLILQAFNITARQFAEEIGIQPSGMSHILSGRNNPSLDFVLKVINRYPDIDTDWLLFGKGAMFTSAKHISNSDSIIEDKSSSIETSSHNDTPNLFSEIEDSKPSSSSLYKDNKEEALIPQKDASNDDNKSDILSNTMHDNNLDSNNNVESVNVNIEERKLIKIVMFYSDNTFVEYHS